ncbi:hypothetical protein BDQ17DRAFT_1430027 [Cyathus striatus]|nr:hypothetical protein BDQ17DRAFT_1430027 [Cyathus striatus]
MHAQNQAHLAGVATQPSEHSIPSNNTNTATTGESHSTLVQGTTRTPDAPCCFYRDVASSRPPSPQEETTTQNSGTDNLSTALESISVNNNIENESISFVSTLTLSESNNEQDNKNPWITVKSRRSGSLESFRGRRINLRKANPSKQPKPLSKAQKQTVQEAEKTLTPEQKRCINHQNDKLCKHSSSCDKGTSKVKGKGVDPCNWGNIDPNESELDVEAQQAVLESLKPVKNEASTPVPHKSKRKAVNVNNLSTTCSTAAKSRNVHYNLDLIHQIPSASHLEKSFDKHAHNKKCHLRSGSPSSPDDSDGPNSDSSSALSPDSDDSSSSSSSSEYDNKDDHLHHHKK